VEMDFNKIFDRVNHDKLMGQLAKRIGDKRTLKLIRSYLNCGILGLGKRPDGRYPAEKST